MSIILAIAYVKVLSVLIYISSFSFVFGNYIIAWLHYILDSCVSNHTFFEVLLDWHLSTNEYITLFICPCRI